MINENETILYRVKVQGNVFLDRVDRNVAEAFVSSLSPSTQSHAKIEAVTAEEGLQVLLG